MKKLKSIVDGETVLKYQVAAEELDALVSVKSDEDLCYMLDEINRCEAAGGPRLRAFLFPPAPVLMEHHQTGSSFELHTALAHRYIDAINGIVRWQPHSIKKHPMLMINAAAHHGLFSLSNCSSSSPGSPDTEGGLNGGELATVAPINYHHNYYSTSRVDMHKVQSSTSLCSSSSRKKKGPVPDWPQPQPKHSSNRDI
ncbi:uncharacterized protein LOC127260423 [Andrographis paniculata]|uniref:uncharacterized protein LOC127260423 n=1 Tax=Andrographis paniculata TaxID=175694 RepID=UPI0021E86A33|nr:uncharacterized protein LOC127260423 [Andrographis paniculata]